MKITSNLNFLIEQEQKDVADFLKEEITGVTYKSTSTDIDILQYAETTFYAKSNMFEGNITLPQFVQFAQKHEQGDTLKEKMLLVASDYQFLIAYQNITMPEAPKTVIEHTVDIDNWLAKNISEEDYWKNQNQANIPLSLTGITHGMTFNFGNEQLNNTDLIKTVITNAILEHKPIEQVLDAGLSSIIRDNQAILLVDPKPSLSLNR